MEPKSPATLEKLNLILSSEKDSLARSTIVKIIALSKNNKEDKIQFLKQVLAKEKDPEIKKGIEFILRNTL